MAEAAAESDVEQYELTEDEDEREEKASDAPKRTTGKRKRSLSQNDEEEIARRRRRRRSLAYQQRRRSLTSSNGNGAQPAHSKQYISDMYSTIIKMSSENKINVKNSWSLHLIDHMEDILDSSKKIAGEDADDDTYNFQKASCTLDASIKIYSYRVDDTWNSSYKILENLSRTEQKHGVDDAADSDAEKSSATARKTRKTHARTIEKNLNNINLKSYDTECEADPLFHKMSQSFDEGGAKGMLLANLSVYDGCKILLNSSDVSVVTRKPTGDVAVKKNDDEALEKEKEPFQEKDQAESAVETDNVEVGDVDTEKEVDTEMDAAAESEEKDEESKDGKTSEEEAGSGEEEAKEAEKTPQKVDKPAAKERISLSLFGSLACINQDVQDLEVCPPLYRMYDQLDEYYGDEARHKLGIKNDFLINTPVKGRRKSLGKQDAITMNLAGIMEGASEDESDAEDAVEDTALDFGDDNGEYDGDEDVGPAEEVEEAAPEDVSMEKETEIIDLAGSDVEDEDSAQEGAESGPTIINKEASLKASAADFFRAKVDENLPDNYESNFFSQMIESALVRSASLDEQGGDDQDARNDYSYFDVKMLRNWAGPGHWKFPAVRKIQIKQRQKEEAERDALMETNGFIDDDGVSIKVEVPERPKKASAGAEKKAAILVDFFGEQPDLSKLKAPKAVSSLAISKFQVKKQEEKASDLVLPVDTHIELGLFFRHFLKEKPRYFRRSGGGVVEDSQANGADSSDNTSQPFTYNEDSSGFDGEYEAGYDDEDDGVSGADDPGTEALYSVDNLVQADRVVEKIGVHYERFAKRVDVKKLKGSIWDHLEKKKTVKAEGPVETEKRAEDGKTSEGEKPHEGEVVVLSESGKRLREQDDDAEEPALDTTFENVVESVAGKVPSNVTVSFYFICVLHLANEKGLELVGQDDLRNFQIRQEDN